MAGYVDYEQMAKELLEQSRGQPDQHLRDAIRARAASLAAEDVSLRSGAEHRQAARQKLHEECIWDGVRSTERKQRMLDYALGLDDE